MGSAATGGRNRRTGARLRILNPNGGKLRRIVTHTPGGHIATSSGRLHGRSNRACVRTRFGPARNLDACPARLRGGRPRSGRRTVCARWAGRAGIFAETPSGLLVPLLGRCPAAGVYKNRPVVVVSRDNRLDGPGLVVPLTTKLQGDNKWAYKLTENPNPENPGSIVGPFATTSTPCHALSCNRWTVGPPG